VVGARAQAETFDSASHQVAGDGQGLSRKAN
jgi:hypothetical protein